MSDYSEFNSKQRIVNDLKNVVADAEEILRATADIAGEKVTDLRERITLRLQDARARLADAETIVVDKTKAAARATDDYVKTNPWQSVGIAAAVGFLIGVMINRR